MHCCCEHVHIYFISLWLSLALNISIFRPFFTRCYSISLLLFLLLARSYSLSQYLHFRRPSLIVLYILAFTLILLLLLYIPNNRRQARKREIGKKCLCILYCVALFPHLHSDEFHRESKSGRAMPYKNQDKPSQVEWSQVFNFVWQFTQK